MATDRALQRRRACWWTGGAEPDGALLPPALRRVAHDALGALVPGGGPARPAFRPAQYDGVHPPALEYPAGPGGLRAHLSPCGSTAARAPGTLADGCADSSGLHDGPGGPAGAHVSCQCDLPGTQRGLGKQPRLFRSALARAPARARAALHPGRDAQIGL